MTIDSIVDPYLIQLLNEKLNQWSLTIFCDVYDFNDLLLSHYALAPGGGATCNAILVARLRQAVFDIKDSQGTSEPNNGCVVVVGVGTKIKQNKCRLYKQIWQHHLGTAFTTHLRDYRKRSFAIPKVCSNNGTEHWQIQLSVWGAPAMWSPKNIKNVIEVDILDVGRRENAFLMHASLKSTVDAQVSDFSDIWDSEYNFEILKLKNAKNINCGHACKL